MRKPHSCANCPPTSCRLLDIARTEMSAAQPDMFTLMDAMDQRASRTTVTRPNEAPKEKSDE